MVVIMLYELMISADHGQFILEDENSVPDGSEVWTRQASANRIGVARGHIAIGLPRPRYGGDVRVTIDVRSTRPTDPFDSWDQVAECSIDVPSGQLAVHGPEEYPPNSPPIFVPEGTYRVLVHWGAWDTVSHDDDMAGEDHYYIVLWPGMPIDPTILKGRSTL